MDISLIGNRIKALRCEKGLTQSAFAEAICVSFQAVSAWERGLTPPDLENILRISNFFGVLVDDLLRDEPSGAVLGIDGGGTKTSFVVTDKNGQVLKQFTREGCNPNVIGFDKAFTIISDGIREALSSCSSVKHVFGGIAGSATGSHGEKLIKRLKEAFPFLTVQIKNDCANLFALNDDVQIALVSGTGSVAFVRLGDDYKVLGGWGYLLDEAGSGYDMGRDAIALALSEEDEGKEHCLMSRMLLEKMNVSSPRKAIEKIYTEGKAYIASFSKTVFDAYEKGDENASRIVKKCARHLGELLNLCQTRYNVAPLAIVGGGLFEHNGELICRHLSEHTSVKLISSDLPPVYGACRMARKMLDNKIPDEFYQNFKKSYESGKK